MCKLSSASSCTLQQWSVQQRLNKVCQAGYVAYSYAKELPFMRKAQAKRAKQSKQKRAAMPVKESNPEEWLQGTNFAKVRASWASVLLKAGSSALHLPAAG